LNATVKVPYLFGPGGSGGTATFTRSTNDGHLDGSSAGGDSPNAVKTWVDANIQISPQTEDDPVDDHHVLHVHVNVNDGSGSANAPAGTLVTLSLQNSGGATATFVGASSCTTIL